MARTAGAEMVVIAVPRLPHDRENRRFQSGRTEREQHIRGFKDNSRAFCWYIRVPSDACNLVWMCKPVVCDTTLAAEFYPPDHPAGMQRSGKCAKSDLGHHV